MTPESKINSIVDEMFRNINFAKEPAGLYDPLRYMLQIGGKRIRPRLCLTTYSLFKDGIGEEIIEPARALEIFHSFTLMHDDIMDRSPLRRGAPTVWKKWNEDTAILSGDTMLIDAYVRVAKAPHAARENVLELFSKTATGVCEGQQLDMDFEARTQITMPEYERMIGLKTAVLLACSAKMGALIAGATPDEYDAFYNYGYALGMAFQVADDYLDAFGDVKVFGKPIGGDILNGKKSWLTVRALEKTSDKDGFLKAFCAPAATEEEKAAKILTVKNIYTALGVDSDARGAIEKYSSDAMKAIEPLALSGVHREVLRRFVENLICRAK